MATAAEKPSTLVIYRDAGEPPSVQELRSRLQNQDVKEKIEAMKTILMYMLNGDPLPQLMMPVIQFVQPVFDTTLKKLLLLYWEIAQMRDAEGKLLREMILVVNHLRSDLKHPNEYLRGAALRLVCKLREGDLLEPLVSTIRELLEDKHAYVRRVAVLALYNIIKNFDHLVPDGPELVYSFLMKEGDLTAKRNAFITLTHTAQDKAIQYLTDIIDNVGNLGEVLQLAALELIRNASKSAPQEKPKFLKCVFLLIASNNSAAQYEAAGALLKLSTSVAAVRASANAYINLLVKESDNNVKMIVLDRLSAIKRDHPKIMQEMVMDILRVLQNPNLDIRRKTLDIVLDMVNAKNVEEVVQLLKKEITRTQAKGAEDRAGEYRQLLIQAIHTCATKFPDIVSSIVHVLMDFLGDSSGSAVDVIVFVREVVEMYPSLRNSIIVKLLETFSEIKSSKVYRTSLWLVGEYAETKEEIDLALTSIREQLGGAQPLLSEDEDEVTQAQTEKQALTSSSTSVGSAAPVKSSRPKLNLDGTYATQSALTEESSVANKKQFSSNATTTTNSNQPSLRGMLLSADFFLGAVLSATLTKLALKTLSMNIDQIAKNLVVSEALLTMANILRYGESHQAPTPLDPDSKDRIVTQIRILTEPNPLIRNILLQQCRASFTYLLSQQKKATKQPEVKAKKRVDVQADDIIKFRLLTPKRTLQDDEADSDDFDLARATGAQDVQEDIPKFNRVHQLTGFSDPLYAEAFVTVHQYDITMDVFVLNQTPETLQNVQLELSTLGDLKLVDRPQSYTIAPHSKTTIKANIKVSSTETGIIFGNIVYDVAGQSSSDKRNVILQDIHVDIMDYIQPATCTELKFRSMWVEFEWENKVAVSTNLTDLSEFLKHIMKSTTMACLTPDYALAGESGFLSANLYARSVFGEDALANVSVEKNDNKITGFIRIRSKTQGIALSLGDKITAKQKSATAAS